MDVTEELKKIIAAKKGNKEFAIFHNSGGGEGWSFELGNPSQYVSLGEVEGEISTSGNTLEEIILKMKKKLGI